MTVEETTTTPTVTPPSTIVGTTPTLIIEDEIEQVVHFQFDNIFQSKIAALVIRDLEFVRKIDGLIRWQYFADINEQHLVRIALDYYSKYKRIPADVSIYKNLLSENVTARLIKKEALRAVIDKLIEIRKMDVSDRDYVIDQVATFARHQAIAKAMEESIPKLDSRDFASIIKTMGNAFNVGVNVDTNEYDYGAMLESRTVERLERLAGTLLPTGISTGYPKLDAALYHKGWGLGELAVLMAGAKVGKTTALMEFGINAMTAGKNVCYITLEVSQKILADRMDANLAERSMMDLDDHTHHVNNTIEAYLKRKPGVFSIFSYPTGTMTVSDLRRLIERKKGNGIIYDLVIVDYADLMQPDRLTDNTMENSKNVYVGLRGLAMQENFAVLTATQTNRTGSTAAVAKAEHVADDFNKIRIADIIISINRTDEERAQNQARLYLAASRNSASGYSIRIKQALDRMKFITEVVGAE